ncbi:hypothetical protein BDA96_10G264300 [Sorghum bicolor]|uniref:Uncharacterized protein n=2 Tax=Sorghum bicolor TaxID=4558 RepID=A0A921U1M1_SORBI|nr:hypothetical protein BDA96_10G264300 [Sorghum bicolor]KXG20457.1 hypothetical protein SORBI_3010G203100 [Sorghum bicolor]
MVCAHFFVTTTTSLALMWSISLRLDLDLAAALFKRLDCPRCLLAFSSSTSRFLACFFSTFPCFLACAMDDFFPGYDLNVRLEDEDGNLPFDLNDDNKPEDGDSDGNAEFQMVEPDDDDGNNFFDLNDPPLEHGNGLSFFSYKKHIVANNR